MQLLQSVGRQVVVCAVTGSCNADLKARSNHYIEMPVVSHFRQTAPALMAGAGVVGC